jgi:uncharacterized protein (TIGR01777 family)
LVRRPAAGGDEAEWNPETGHIDLVALAGCDAVVNLCGENIAAGRWLAARRERIRASRVRPTELLAALMRSGSWRPRVWVNASAVGFYGDGGERELDETAPQGSGFLASVCGEWESATAPAQVAGVRVVRLRLGVVLDPSGGALAKLLPLFRAGLGGPVSGGRAWMSWIALDELCRVVDLVLRDERIVGPVNAVSPEPVRNAVLARALGRALHRPAVLPVPGWAVRGLFGQMGTETLLASQRAVPAVLVRNGHDFLPGGLGGALGRMLG